LTVGSIPARQASRLMHRLGSLAASIATALVVVQLADGRHAKR
jgi:hypothetical protein